MTRNCVLPSHMRVILTLSSILVFLPIIDMYVRATRVSLIVFVPNLRRARSLRWSRFLHHNNNIIYHTSFITRSQL